VNHEQHAITSGTVKVHRRRPSFRSHRRAALAAEAQAIASRDPEISRIFHALAGRLGFVAHRVRQHEQARS
jgi:hypothetical protein